MAEKIRVMLDKDRDLVYRSRDMRDLENDLQLPPQKWLELIGQQSIKIPGKLLFYGFRHAAPQLRENQVLDMLDTYLDNGGDITVIRERITEALMRTGAWGPDALERFRSEMAVLRRGFPSGNAEGPQGAAP